jgi:DNA-directed RNA polymerase subunit RPC12/RpoP
MAIYSCGWCKHDVIQSDTHVRVTPPDAGDQNWCRDCRFCIAARAKQEVAE